LKKEGPYRNRRPSLVSNEYPGPVIMDLPPDGNNDPRGKKAYGQPYQDIGNVMNA
jgi:hypothetical protein